MLLLPNLYHIGKCHYKKIFVKTRISKKKVFLLD